MKNQMLALLAVAAIGCGGTVTSRELRDARSAFDRAADGDAARLAPDKLYQARKSLTAAEKAHQEEDGSWEERQLGYIAQREANAAIAYGDLAKVQKQSSESQARFDDVRRRAAEMRASQSQQALAEQTRASQDRQRALDAEKAKRGELEKEFEGEKSKLEEKLKGEEGKRQEAENKAAEAQNMLDQIARLREGKTNKLTLTGAIVFATGKSDLLPAAQRALDEVAEALKEQGTERDIVIEGHTDSVGDDSANQALSEARAKAVRDYLVSRGLHAGRVTAVGRGEATPVASNDSLEGRALNRRVEIVIQPANK